MVTTLNQKSISMLQDLLEHDNQKTRKALRDLFKDSLFTPRYNISLDEEILVSKKAWKTGGSKMFIEVGKRVKVRDILQGVITVSGNDASVALA